MNLQDNLDDSNIIPLTTFQQYEAIILNAEFHKKEKIIKFTLADNSILTAKITLENNRLVFSKLVKTIKDELRKTRLNFDEFEVPLEQTLNNNIDKIFEICKLDGNTRGTESSEEKKKFSTLKYSGYRNESSQLYESVIVGGRSCFLDLEEGRIQLREKLEEEERILVPPCLNEVPHHPYSFTDEEEIANLLNFTKSLKFEDIFKYVKQTVSKYVSHDEFTKTLIAADIVFSYFQDRFGLTHYLQFIGENGVGKSAIGDIFAIIGYRGAKLTDINAANVFRLIGCIEPGQCTIINEEAEKIDKSSELRGVLKTGYELGGKIPRVNPNSMIQEFFHTYGLKVMLSETSPDTLRSKGFLSRTFVIQCYPGKPKYFIKEVLNNHSSSGKKQLYEELITLRKILLLYKLLHFHDDFPEININLEGRDRELCISLLQMSFSSSVHQEIQNSLQHFMSKKTEKQNNSFEAFLGNRIKNLIDSKFPDGRVSLDIIWEDLLYKLDLFNLESQKSIYLAEFDAFIHRNTISKIMKDKFGAEIMRDKRGSVIVFHKDKLESVLALYEKKIEIKCEMEGVSGVSSVGNNEGPPLIQNLLSSTDSLSVLRDTLENKVKNNDSSSNLEPREALNNPRPESICSQQNDKDINRGNTIRIAETELTQSPLNDNPINTINAEIDAQKIYSSESRSTGISCRYCTFQHPVEFEMRVHYEEKHYRHLLNLREEWDCYDIPAITYRLVKEGIESPIEFAIP